MPVYSVRIKGTEKEVTRYSAAAVALLDQYPLSGFDHVEYVEGTPDTRVYGGRRQLTRLEFMRLFTSAERIAIRDFIAGTTVQAKAGRDFMAMMELSNEVDLDDADTVAGVNFMEARGLIAVGRAVEILNG